MTEFLIYAAVFFGTIVGVKAFVEWSRRRRLLDIPNERSSHTRPTPRGGGLIIVLICLSFYVLYTNFAAGDFVWQYFVGALLIAVISWLDDLYSISSLWRILIHAAAAFLIVQTLNETSFLESSRHETDSIRIAGLCAAFLWTVWLTNAYNFMDGIDGIAGAQAACAGVGWLFIGKFLHLETVGIFGGALAVSALGFLIFNRHPAKVFMGDVGSAFLGFSFAALPLMAAKKTSGGLFSWLFIGAALVWLFFFDTAITLFRRILKRENFWQAHRTHVYQQLVVSGFSHTTVAALYGVLSALNAASIVGVLMRKNLVFVFLSFVLVQSIGLLLFVRRAKKRKLLREQSV